jgi:hypothetical protein
VHYQPVEVSDFADGLTAKGLPTHLIQHFSIVPIDYRNGIFAGTNDIVETIGGTKPMTVEDYVNAHKRGFRHSGMFAIPDPTTHHIPAPD